MTKESISLYGQFTEDGECFELKAEPPRRWMNTHSNEVGDIELFSNVTHVGDGLTKFRTPNGAEVTVCGWESKYLKTFPTHP